MTGKLFVGRAVSLKPRAQPQTRLRAGQLMRVEWKDRTIHLPEGGSWKLTRGKIPLYLWFLKQVTCFQNTMGQVNDSHSPSTKEHMDKIEVTGLNWKLRGSRGWQGP